MYILSFAAVLVSGNEVLAAEFSDVPNSHYAYDAITYLSKRGIVAGFSDKTYRPDIPVTRAEAIKVITAEFVEIRDGEKRKSPGYQDVLDGSWYIPYLEWALKHQGIIDAPQKNKYFAPARTVKKAEFFKMLFATHQVDLQSFGDIAIPLSPDVNDAKAWYYPVVRYAVATATAFPTKSGHLLPNNDLSRGDVAMFLYRYMLFREHLRTPAQIEQAQKEVSTIIVHLSDGAIRSAEYASARGILLTRSALQEDSEDTTVKVAVKIAEGYRALTRAYRASVSGDFGAVEKLSTDAAYLADQAVMLSSAAKDTAEQLKGYAKSFQDQVHSSMKQ